MVASRMRLRRSRCASEPSSDSASTATVRTSRGCAPEPVRALAVAGSSCWRDMRRQSPPSMAYRCKTIRMAGAEFLTSAIPDLVREPSVSCCDGVRLDCRSLALLEHVLVGRTGLLPPNRGGRRWLGFLGPSPPSSSPRVSWCVTGPRVRAAIAAARDVEQGEPDAWRPVFAGLAELGLFGVAVAEDAGGAGGIGRRPVRHGRRGGRRAGARTGGDDARWRRWWSTIPSCWKR